MTDKQQKSLQRGVDAAKTILHAYDTDEPAATPIGKLFKIMERNLIPLAPHGAETGMPVAAYYLGEVYLRQGMDYFVLAAQSGAFTQAATEEAGRVFNDAGLYFTDAILWAGISPIPEKYNAMASLAEVYALQDVLGSIRREAECRKLVETAAKGKSLKGMIALASRLLILETARESHLEAFDLIQEVAQREEELPRAQTVVLSDLKKRMGRAQQNMQAARNKCPIIATGLTSFKPQKRPQPMPLYILSWEP